MELPIQFVGQQERSNRNYPGWCATAEGDERHAAFAFHRELVKNVYLPFITIIDPLVFLAELAFAVSLMLGLGVRFVAIVAAVYSLHLWLGLYGHPAEWPWNYMFLAIVHVQFAVYAAGRSLGLDELIRRRAPGNAITRLAALAG